MPSDTRAASALSSSRGTGTKPVPGCAAVRDEDGEAGGGMGRRGTTGGAAPPIGRRGMAGALEPPVCEGASEVAAVKVLRREAVRVMMPSLGGGAKFGRGSSSRGDGGSRIFMLTSPDRSSESSISLTFVFFVYFDSKMRSTVAVMVNM